MGEVLLSWNGDGVFTGREPHTTHESMTSSTKNFQQGDTEEFAFLKRQFNKVAWRRAWGIAVAIGILGAIGASKEIDNSAEAFGYAVGYGGAAFVMGTSAAIICGRGRKE